MTQPPAAHTPHFSPTTADCSSVFISLDGSDHEWGEWELAWSHCHISVRIKINQLKTTDQPLSNNDVPNQMDDQRLPIGNVGVNKSTTRCSDTRPTVSLKTESFHFYQTNLDRRHRPGSLIWMTSLYIIPGPCLARRELYPVLAGCWYSNQSSIITK